MLTLPYLRAHFHRVGIALILTLVGLTLIPHMVYYDPIETAVEKTGHLRDILLEKGRDSSSNRYSVHFKEYTAGFEITGLTDGDQYLLTQAEKVDNLFTFSVTAADWRRALAGNNVPLTGLKSDKNVYLSNADLGALMRKGRGMAFFFTALAMVLAVLQWRKVKKHAAEFQAATAANSEDESSGSRSQAGAPGEEGDPGPILDYDVWWITAASQPWIVALGTGTFLGYLIGASIPGGRGTWVGFGFLIAGAVIAGLTQLFLPLWQGLPVIARVLSNHQRRLAGGPPRPTTSKPKHLKAVEILLKHKGNVNAQNDKGQSAMHISAQVGATEAVQLLLQNGAKLDIQDEEGNTPLHIAAMNNRNSVVFQLVKEGADVLMVNAEGQTALAFLNGQKTKNNSLIEHLTQAEAAAKVRAEKAKVAAAEKAALEAKTAAEAAPEDPSDEEKS